MENTIKGLVVLGLVLGIGFIVWDFAGELLTELNWKLLWAIPIISIGYLLGKNVKVQKLW